MLWSHFSETPFVLDEKSNVNGVTASGKRGGLWLADETKETKEKGSFYTWSEKCVLEDFRVERLTYKTDVEVDMEKIYVIDGTDMEDMKRFHKEYFEKYGGTPG